MNKLERYSIGSLSTFAKTENNLPRIEGYACKFDTYSELMWGEFYTVIDPHFFDGILELADLDVKANIAHENEDILARYYPMKGVKTLSLSVDQTGLLFGFDTPNTTLGRDTAENVRIGNIVGCSMAVSVLEDDWRGTYNGYQVRRLLKCGGLEDVCLTVDPWFTSTDVASKYGKAFMSKEDYLSMSKKPAPNSVPDEFYSNTFKLIELDRK